MIKAVIFDNDGVLIDSHGIFVNIVIAIVQKEWGISLRPQDFAEHSGLRYEETIQLLTKDRKIPINDVKRVVDLCRDEYYANGLMYVKLQKGVKPLLDSLKKKGFKLGIATNGGREQLEKILHLTGIAKYFDAIVTYDDVAVGKPSPLMFQKNATLLKLTPAECVVIEDSSTGVRGAKAAGMKVIGVLTTQTRENLKSADIIVDAMDKISADMISGM